MSARGSSVIVDLEGTIAELAPRVLRYASARLGDASQAEDVAQESLAALVRACRNGGAPESPEAFVFAVARRRAGRVAWRRRLWAPLELAFGARSDAPSPETRAIAQNEMARVRSALGRAPTARPGGDSPRRGWRAVDGGRRGGPRSLPLGGQDARIARSRTAGRRARGTFMTDDPGPDIDRRIRDAFEPDPAAVRRVAVGADARSTARAPRPPPGLRRAVWRRCASRRRPCWRSSCCCSRCGCLRPARGRACARRAVRDCHRRPPRRPPAGWLGGHHRRRSAPGSARGRIRHCARRRRTAMNARCAPSFSRLLVVTLAAPALAQDATAKKVTLDLNGVAPARRVQGRRRAIGVSVTVDVQRSRSPSTSQSGTSSAKTALNAMCESIGCQWTLTDGILVVRAAGCARSASASDRAVPRSSKAATPGARAGRSWRPSSASCRRDMKFDNAPLDEVSRRLTEAARTDRQAQPARTPDVKTLTMDFGNLTLRRRWRPLANREERPKASWRLDDRPLPGRLQAPAASPSWWARRAIKKQ